MMMTEAATFGWKVLLQPQSHLVMMFLSQFRYCSITGTI